MMSAQPEFVQYIAPRETHDATVKGVIQDGSVLRVQLQSPEGREILIVFSGTEKVQSNSPEGMSIYSVSEIREEAPLRHFVFVNTEEDSSSSLDVFARECKVSVFPK